MLLGLELDKEESIDLSNVVTHINSHPTTREHLETLFSEADDKGHREIIQSLWDQETNMQDRMEILKDQQTCSKSI